MDKSEIKKIRANLEKRSLESRKENEDFRMKTLVRSRRVLKEYFERYRDCRVYLAGSILKPFAFSSDSDIDIAVENFPGTRIDLYTDLSHLFDYPVDIIFLEKCHFSDEIKKNGLLISG
jgi:uncharacterized protein